MIVAMLLIPKQQFVSAVILSKAKNLNEVLVLLNDWQQFVIKNHRKALCPSGGKILGF
jgi:hypothetical protein